MSTSTNKHWFVQIQEAEGRKVRVETSDGVELNDRLTSLRYRDIVMNGVVQRVLVGLVLNEDQLLELSQIAKFDVAV